jgi:tRNA-dihydrouridine synthase B
MVSAKGLVYNSPGTRDLLATTPAEQDLVVQLFGADLKCMQEAMAQLAELGFKYFDLNAGCPVRKVIKTGAGAALLKTPDTLLSLLEAMLDIAGKGYVGVKLRPGWQVQDTLYLELASDLEAMGLGWISLHPRSAKQAFSGNADWNKLRFLKERTSLPVIGSGDLFTASDAFNCLQQTGISTIMFARGALNNPMIFADYLKLLSGKEPEERSIKELTAMIRRHGYLCQKYADEHKSLLKMRSIVPRYVRGFHGARHLRQELASCTSWERFEELLTLLEKQNTGQIDDNYKTG